MPALRVERGATARLDKVDGDLAVGKGARIVAKDGLVSVSGAAFFEGDATIASDFECDSLTVERWGELKVAGDLSVRKGIDVANSVEVKGQVKARTIDVGGKLVAGSVSCGGAVRAGGVVKVEGALEAELVDVGGRVVIGGAAKIKDLEVGGRAELAGGSITGRAKVGGVFESSAALEFGELQVYGRCTLPAGCKGRRIAASGKLSVAGDISCDDIDVGGVADVRGNCEAKTVTINGKLDVSGSLSSSGTLENYGSGDVKGDFTGSDLRIGGRFKARKVLLENEARITGELLTREGTKARSVMVESGSKCRGPLVGERVELSKSKMVVADWTGHWAGQVASLRLVGRMTNVEDVYADELVLGPNTRCRNVFARTVDLGAGCVAEQVTYSGELRRGHHGVHLTRPSEKVEKLPPFPL